jgi:alpha-L-fucosidase
MIEFITHTMNMMKGKLLFIGVLWIAMCFSGCKTTSKTNLGHNSTLIPSAATEAQIVKLAANVAPSPRQLSWQEMEFTAFFHFTVNTFTDKEWGDGKESPSVFNPTNLDAKQWVKTAKDAGIKLVIITCKHHDGFCLWPSKFTEHSVKNSPYKNGNGDVVKEVAEACKELGVKFGVYLSPWDRHEQTYGDSPAYDKYFRNLLTELLSNYGNISEVWFDGACGEGPNGKKQVYDWKSYYSVIRKLQPNATIAVMGPDVRWVGTETGYGRETEWSVVPASAQSVADISANSQQKASDGAFVPSGDMVGADLGSRTVISTAKGLVWYPSEVDVSIRPGWFYHSTEDKKVKSPEKLLDIYFSSVGRNSLLLLNIPPDRRGLLHENDVRNLMMFRKAVDDIFATNYLSDAKINSDSHLGKQKAEYIIDNDNNSWWAAASYKTTATLNLSLNGSKTFDVLLLQENIQTGQRIESFVLEGWVNGAWQKLTEGTTVGYKRLIRFNSVTTDKVRLLILKSRLNPTLSSFGLYRNLPETKITSQTAVSADKIEVSMNTNDSEASIYYTLDGTEPNSSSLHYTKPFTLENHTIVKAMSIRKDGVQGFVQSVEILKTK